MDVERKQHENLILTGKVQNDNGILNDTDKKVLIEKRKWSIVPRDNTFLSDVGEDVKSVFGLPWFGFHLMAPADELHTL